MMFAISNVINRKIKINYFLLIFTLLIYSFNSFAQSYDLKLKVTDEVGGGIANVGVTVKGTELGGVTSETGEFSLKVSQQSGTLVLSHQSYEQKEVDFNEADRELEVTMVPKEQEAIEEVVVTGFGLSQKKESLTSAISTLGAEDIKRSNASTTSGALVGKIPGLNSRQTDGRPGAGTSLQIRNMGDPLYVIDGVQKDAGQFNNLDFNDIENISVLKDASASIYGVRAANGVIVVTTKKGKRNTPNEINIQGDYGFQNVSTFAKPADALTYIESYIQSETVQGITDYRYSAEDLEKWKAGTEKGYVPFDWYDYIWKTSPQQYLSVNTSGGSENINYYFSAGHLNQDAMFKNYGGFKRTNLQMNIESQISKKIKIGASFNGRHERRVNPGVPGEDDYWLPRFGTYRNLPTKRPFANDNPLYPALTSNDPGTNFGWLTYDRSGKYEDTWRVGQMNFDLDYEILEGLNLKALAGYYFANQKLDNHEYTYELYEYDEDSDTYPVVFENTNPWRERRQGHVEELTSNIQLSYAKQIEKHDINILAGVETILRDEPTAWLHSIPTSNSLNLIDYETMDQYDDVGNNTQARIGYVGRLNYNYEQKYLLEFSGRYDGSWKFPPNHRWGFFPSVSAGWRMSSENFWNNSSFLYNNIEDFKLRASYGLLGDDNVAGYSAFDYMDGFNYKSGGAVIGGEYVIGSEPRGLPVTTLSWITAKSFDVGFDFSLLNGRLNGSIDYFQRKRDGLPASRYDVLLPSEVGFGLPQENLNSDMHRGWDAMLSYSNQWKELTYRIGGNVTYSRFYDWHQYKPRFSNSWDEYRSSINERYGHINWGLEADGQFQSWEEIAEWQIDNDRQGNKTLRPGDIKYVDQNGDGVINHLDERPIGYREDSTPILNFGLNFSFQLKGFDLAFDLTGGGLNSWYQDWEQRNPFHDGGNNPQYYMEDAWGLEDIFDKNSALVPGKYPMLLIGNSSHSNYWNSTFWKKNVRYLKLRNLEFGYMLPTNLLERAGITATRVYFSGQNLLTFSNLIGVDPESNESNGLGYPTTRIFNFGFNLTF